MRLSGRPQSWSVETYHGPLTGPDPEAAVVLLLSVQSPHEGTDGGASDDVDRDSCFIQGLQDADLGATPADSKRRQATPLSLESALSTQ